MAKNVPKIILNNGIKMPILGLGTFSSKNNEGENAVKHAIDIGYRHIDTAYLYQNESEVGKAIRDKIAEGVVKRDDIFLVTKLWSIHHDPDLVEKTCHKSLKNLGLDYIDLYLMHFPVGYAYIDDKTFYPKDSTGKSLLTDVDYLDTWKAMEHLVKIGLVKSIGISNFNSEQIDRLLQSCEIKPVVNQVECSPAFNQKELTKFCKDRNIVLTAYCPLGRPKPDKKEPDFIYSDKIRHLAEKHNKTPAQIVLRYLLDLGVTVIPKSSNMERIEQNFNIFNFELTAEDSEVMDRFHSGKRLVTFDYVKDHKYYPFDIKY